MKKSIYLVAALTAFLALKPAPASAGGLFDFLFPGDPRVSASGLIVGAGTTGAYFALKPHHHRQRNGLSNGGAAALTTVGCMVLAPMLAAAWVDATEHRELTSREALGLASDCVIPFLGSWYWNRAFAAHPEWTRRKKR